MKVALYVRVSTHEQTVDSQLVSLREYSRSRGFQIVEEFIDRGISGSTASRPRLDALMRDALRTRFEAVVVFRFDRFARSTRHLLTALDTFRRLRIAFISVSELIDTSTPMGEAMFTIVSAISQLERDIIRERIKSGLKAARARGRRLGRPKSRDDFRIQQLRKEGHSLRTIATKLGVSVGAVQRALAVSKCSDSDFVKAK